jgi:hypothetical protein
MSTESRIAHDVAERQVAMFSMFVGQGLTVTRAALARASGIPESTLKSYAGGAAMPFHAALVLNKFLPAEAMQMVTETAGVRFTTIETSETNWDEIASESAGLTFEICEARRDGRIDHVEEARLKRRARALIADLADVVEN